jgi:predicted permease
MATILQDVRYAVRQLRRSPGFAATVVLTMALGIGANATVFGVLDALILKPLDLPEAQQLMSLNLVGSDHKTIPFNSYPDFRDMRERNKSFSEMAAYGASLVGIEYAGNTSRNWIMPASDGYFDLVRIKPYLGRFFTPTDAHGPDSMPYAVMTYDFWRERTNSDPQVVGKVLELNKHPFTIIGVAPPAFYGTEIFLRPDLFVPMLNQRQLDGTDYLEDRASHGLFVIARLKPNITAAAATNDLNAIASELAKEHKEDDGLLEMLSKPGLGANYMREPGQAALTVIMALAGLVLLAACANLASLFSARAGDRARELAVRLALGSSRRRLLRQLVVESLLISLLGGALGLALGRFLLAALSRWRPSADIPIQLNVNADWSVTALALGLSMACGLFFGLVPARAIWRNNPYQIIKQGTAGSGRGRLLTFRDVLLLLQVTLCAVLVTSSLVAARGLVRSIHASYGFRPEGVTLASFDLQMAGYTQGQAYQFQRRAMESAAQLPGVISAAFAGHTPLSMGEGGTSIWRDDVTDKRASTRVASAAYNEVSPGYMAVAQTTLLAGRDFDWQDDAKSPQVAIVNETFARTVFGSIDCLGRVFQQNDGRRTVVGVVEDGKYENIEEDPRSAIFLPIAQQPVSATTLLVRTTAATGTSETAVSLEKMLKRLDPAIPVTAESWQQSLSLAIFPSFVVTVALGTMGALAAMLALTGVFGMASYAVSRRFRELGIRMALGAARRQILLAAIGRPVQLLALGSILGLAAGALASKLLAVVVYQASSRDPLVLFGVVLGMAGIGALAAWIPARRALAIEPSRLLRED